MQYKYVNNLDNLNDIQIGNHENTVLCAINEYTDRIRRPSGINRFSILSTLSKNNIKNSVLNHTSYFRDLPNYKFVISPEGNGIDCHRHYESLVAGSIPIMEDNPIIREKYEGCPILYTTDYSEITIDYLEDCYLKMLDEKYNFSRLFLSYYEESDVNLIKESGNYWMNMLTHNNWYQ